VIIWHDGTVATADEQLDANRRRLGELVKARRLHLGISVRQAAETAEIARNTWSDMEDGSRRTAEIKFPGIERVLQWQPGSIASIMLGDEPKVLEPRTTGQERADQPGADEADEALIRIMRSSLPDSEKARIVRTLLNEKEAARRRAFEAARERLIALAEQYIGDAADKPR
jgi:transcriptional regulator with XRE-family HTH domain